MLSIACLMAGTALYALLRPLPWMPWQAVAASDIPHWLHAGLPDGLWAAAFSAALLPYVPKQHRKAWVWWPAICMLLLELLQALSLWPGTADAADIVWAFTGCFAIFFLSFNKNRWKNSSEKQAGC